MIIKDLGNGWTIDHDGGDIELRDEGEPAAYIPMFEDELHVVAFGRLGTKQIPVEHVEALIAAWRERQAKP